MRAFHESLSTVAMGSFSFSLYIKSKSVISPLPLYRYLFFPSDRINQL